jgi:metal-responsive CopG/Arc/MetJ family transcriptional regulator
MERTREKGYTPLKRVNVMINEKLLNRIDDFISKNNLSKEKVNRSVFIRDIIEGSFDEFDNHKEDNIIEKKFPKK